MPGPEELHDADFDRASSKLNEGLKVCRSIVDGYRGLLIADAGFMTREETLEDPAGSGVLHPEARKSDQAASQEK